MYILYSDLYIMSGELASQATRGRSICHL